MNGIKGSFERFAEWGTRSRRRLFGDAFFVTRLRLAGMYFIGGSIAITVGWVLGYLARAQFYKIAVAENGDAVFQAIDALEKELLVQRIVIIVLFALVAYYLTELALRPIRRTAELQKRFVAVVSHELRTPLTIMKNGTEVLLRNTSAVSKERAVAALSSNLEEVNRLSETIQFLLTFSELQNRRPRELPDIVALADIIESATPAFIEECASAGIRFDTSYAPGKYAVRGNAIALAGLLDNLVKNAMRHTPRGGSVLIALKDSSSHVTLAVSDTGTGIAPEDMPFIFEPYYRGKNAHTRSGQGGVGLGLSIVKEIADLHRATVQVATGPSEGTVFTVSFPKG